LADWERELMTPSEEWQQYIHYSDNHPNNRAYARSQEDHMYDDDNYHATPEPVSTPDPAFAAIRPILRYLPGAHRAEDATYVTDVESLASFLLSYNAAAQDDNYSLRETVTELRRQLEDTQTRANELDYANRRLTAQVEFAAKYPGEKIEDVVLAIAKANGLGTDSFRNILAIKDVRARFNNGLKEAKDLVDAARDSYVPDPA
jgi:ribosomal protein L7/L12